MTTFDTGNPLGSSDPRDLFDNARNTDDAVNGEGKTWTDRFGRTRVSMKGVEEAVPDAIAARDRAESAAEASVAASSAVPYNLLSELLMAPHPGPSEKAWAIVTNDPADGNNGYYSWTGSEWVRSALQPASFSALASVQSLIRSASDPVNFETVIDEAGAVLRVHDSLHSRDAHHDVSESEAFTGLGDDSGAMLLHADDDGVRLGPLEFGYTAVDGVFVVDEEGSVLQNLSDPVPDPAGAVSALDDGVYFPGAIIGWASDDVTIHVPSILKRRELASSVMAALYASVRVREPDALGGASSSKLIKVPIAQLGASAILAVRDIADRNVRVWRDAPVHSIGVQSPAIAIKVMLIGDSISNRQGAYLLDENLRSNGINASWIGTMPGVGPTDTDGIAGPLGECKEGWETGDFTYSVNDRVIIVPPGGEAEYLALSKIDKWPRNVFLRTSTGSDDPALVRNGHVFDMRFYLDRFSLANPDVVIYAPGTNDVRDRSAAEVYNAVYRNDEIVYKQIRAALPSAKILRTIPGTSMSSTRDADWSDKYILVIKAMLDAIRDFGGGVVHIAPAWAMVDQECGYRTAPATADATTGFSTSYIDDAIHPTLSNRRALFRVLAAYVAACATNQI